MRAHRDVASSGAAGKSTESWRRLWEFTPPPPKARVALIAIVAIALVADGIIELTTPKGSVAAFVDVGMFFAIALFTWRPPIAAAALVGGAVFALWGDVGGAYVLALAGLTGLVIYTCSRWVTVGYLAATAIWVVSTSLATQELTEGGSVGVVAVGLASALIGWAFRRGRRREDSLVEDVHRLTQDAATAIKRERERIADELHNIIAHDITIVVMHARALSLVAEASERKLSTDTIVEAATQALTDVRRMLHIVQEQSHEEELEGAGRSPLLHELCSIRNELSSLGMYVTVSAPQSIEISHAINATLGHIAHESATNIMKHASNAAEVRITLSTEEDRITLTVWNSAGVKNSDWSESPSGYGLNRMSERVSLLGGAFSASGDGTGWIVKATLPST